MKTTTPFFRTGIEELDRLIGKALLPGSFIVVAGHPGAGKTTLASSICYANMLNNKKCLYVSFQEDKEKLYRNLLSVNIDFKKMENKGLLRFLKLPLPAHDEAVEKFLDKMIELIIKNEPKVIIIDSITPLLNTVKDNVKARALLQNFFAEIPKEINGLVVLIAEIPMMEEKIMIGDIEFVADAILILKHRVERNLLVRELEIRKVRGVPINLAKVPIAIIEGKGLVMHAPPILEEIPSRPKELYEFPCTRLRELLKGIRKGDVIYITFPPDNRRSVIWLFIISFILMNNLKSIIISYKRSSEELKENLCEYIRSICMYEKEVRELTKNMIKLYSINPAGVSIGMGILWELSIIEKEHPDVVIFHSVDLPTRLFEEKEYFTSLMNQLLLLKKKGVIIVRIGSRDDKYNLHASLADLVVRIDTVIEKNKPTQLVYIWKVGRDPIILNREDIEYCVSEMMKNISKVIKERKPLNNLYEYEYKSS